MQSYVACKDGQSNMKNMHVLQLVVIALRSSQQSSMCMCATTCATCAACAGGTRGGMCLRSPVGMSPPGAALVIQVSVLPSTTYKHTGVSAAL